MIIVKIMYSWHQNVWVFFWLGDWRRRFQARAQRFLSVQDSRWQHFDNFHFADGFYRLISCSAKSHRYETKNLERRHLPIHLRSRPGFKEGGLHDGWCRTQGWTCDRAGATDISITSKIIVHIEALLKLEVWKLLCGCPKSRIKAVAFAETYWKKLEHRWYS